jgi:hypothetical protein
MVAMNGGGNNGQWQLDVDAKGVNDGGAIVMGNSGVSAMDGKMAAMGSGGGIMG